MTRDQGLRSTPPGSLFPARALRSAFALYRAALKADKGLHLLCRECGYEVSDAEAYYTREEQEALAPEVPAVIRAIRSKDCPSCGAAHTKEPWYEPLYGLPPRDTCLRLAKGELRRVFKVETLYAYPQGHGASERKVIRRWWGRTISERMEANPDAR